MSAGWVDVVQVAISIVTGFVSALVAVGVLTMRVTNMVANLVARQDRLEGQYQANYSKATLQMERADTVTRQSIMETVEKVAVHPMQRLEERIGALEQDMAVVRFQLKGRAYFFPPPVREINPNDDKGS
jgi:hypothetical protein